MSSSSAIQKLSQHSSAAWNFSSSLCSTVVSLTLPSDTSNSCHFLFPLPAFPPNRSLQYVLPLQHLLLQRPKLAQLLRKEERDHNNQLGSRRKTHYQLTRIVRIIEKIQHWLLMWQTSLPTLLEWCHLWDPRDSCFPWNHWVNSSWLKTALQYQNISSLNSLPISTPT